MNERRKTKLKEFSRLSRKAIRVFREQGAGIMLERTWFEILRRLSLAEDARTYKNKALPVKKILAERFAVARPIDFFEVRREGFRFNIVTDSLDRESLFGGVATSLIVATLFANKHHVPLRIITRTTQANPKAYRDFLQLMEIPYPERVEFFSDRDALYQKSHYRLDVSDQDIFLATSWWSAAAVRTINRRKKFFYILQEVETFFYPYGDDRYRCEKILESDDIHFILNSRLLSDYYAQEKIGTVAAESVFFEPAFPEQLYAACEHSFEKKAKSRLFFYARPNNPRNLFATGLKILDEAILRGIVKTNEWEICFAGSPMESLEFSNGATPTILGQMNWKEYSDFLKTVDLGVCLMYTPHPSYPPLDVAASGGVVLTNRFANKQSLEGYSKNILCEELDVEAMMRGFARAVALAQDSETRRKNYRENGLGRSWDTALAEVLKYMDERK